MLLLETDPYWLHALSFGEVESRQSWLTEELEAKKIVTDAKAEAGVSNMQLTELWRWLELYHMLLRQPLRLWQQRSVCNGLLEVMQI